MSTPASQQDEKRIGVCNLCEAICGLELTIRGREVVGVRIAEAGHSVIYFNPAFKQIDWAEATLPMARGRLKVQWKKLPDGGLEVMLDSNVPVKILPEMTREQLGNTEFRLGEKVTLLKPPDDLEDEDEDEGNA